DLAVGAPQVVVGADIVRAVVAVAVELVAVRRHGDAALVVEHLHRIVGRAIGLCAERGGVAAVHGSSGREAQATTLLRGIESAGVAAGNIGSRGLRLAVDEELGGDSALLSVE